MRTSAAFLTGFIVALCATPAPAQQQRQEVGAQPPTAVLPDTTVTAPRPRRLGGFEPAELPAYGNPGAAHPTRVAAFNVGYVFGQRSHLAGNPGAAARAIMELEFLCIEVFANPEYAQGRATLYQPWRRAKPEWRAVLGMPTDAPAQAVIDGLRAVMEPLAAGGGPEVLAALPPAVFTLGQAETWNRLNVMPSLPHSNFAGVLTAGLMRRPVSF